MATHKFKTEATITKEFLDGLIKKYKDMQDSYMRAEEYGCSTISIGALMALHEIMVLVFDEGFDDDSDSEK